MFKTGRELCGHPVLQATRRIMWSMHDGSIAYFAREVKQFLGSQYPRRREKLLWPPPPPPLHTGRLLPVGPCDARSLFEIYQHLRCVLKFHWRSSDNNPAHAWMFPVHQEFLGVTGFSHAFKLTENIGMYVRNITTSHSRRRHTHVSVSIALTWTYYLISNELS
jgi:hypothetical protein